MNIWIYYFDLKKQNKSNIFLKILSISTLYSNIIQHVNRDVKSR